MKDLLNTLTLSDYIGEISAIPLYKPNRKNNRAKPSNKTCSTARKLGAYRTLLFRRENILKQIEVREAICKHLEDNCSHACAEGYRTESLTELYLGLAKTVLKMRKLESVTKKIKQPLARYAAAYRYLDPTLDYMPTWSQTVKAIGIPVSGNELREYVSDILSKIEI